MVAEALLMFALGAGGWHEGRAVYYNPGVMETVSRNRGMPIVACMAAHPTLPIGSWLILSGRSSMVCRVTDTSQPADRLRHIRTGLVELDYNSAKAICPRGWTGAHRECPIRWKPIDAEH